MKQKKVLVTGATGFLGRRAVGKLMEKGFFVKALVRNTSKTGNLAHLDIEIVQGDVTNPDSLEQAFENVDYVVHAAADTSGTKEGAGKVTIGGTRNILDLCTAHNVKKLVYISSCSVYGSVDYEDGQIIDESATVERFPELRGIYSWAKHEAEKIVLDYMKQNKAKIVCLRPGTIYGPGGENFSPMMGFFLKNIFFVIRRKGFIMPLVYIDNLVEAIIAAMVQDKSTGQVYNVVDSQKVSKKDYMEKFIRRLYPFSRCLYLPYSLLFSAVILQEWLFRTLKRDPVLSRYRLISSQRSKVYDSSKIMNDLGWYPLYSFEQAIEKIVELEKKDRKIK